MKVIKILLIAIPVILLTGCNKQIIDLEYSYNKAICVIGNETKEIEIKKWKDYEDGEQLQITDKEGNVYLVSSYNCILVKEK